MRTADKVCCEGELPEKHCTC